MVKVTEILSKRNVFVKELVAVTEAVFAPLFVVERDALEKKFGTWIDENLEFEDDN